MEILLLGNRIDAEEALACGLINRIVPRERLLADAIQTARALARNGPRSICAIKRVVHQTFGLPSSEDLAFEAEHALRVFASSDAREGPRAFAEKRDPDYKGT